MAPTTISIVNQKGGTGKTTTAVNLGSALAQLGKRVLLIDLDTQGSLTYYLGINHYEGTLSEVLMGSKKLHEVLVRKEQMDIAPTSVELADAELAMAGRDQREFILKNILQEEAQEYDFVLIDSSPSLSVLTVNALVAADYTLIPILLEVLSVQGLGLVIRTIDRVRGSLNPALRTLGVLPVMVNAQKYVTQEVYDFLQQNLGVRLLKSYVPDDERAIEAPSFGKSMIAYAPESSSAKAYHVLAMEILTLTQFSRR